MQIINRQREQERVHVSMKTNMNTNIDMPLPVTSTSTVILCVFVIRIVLQWRFFCRDYHIRWLTNQSKIKETILKHNSQGVVRDNKMLIGIAKDILISADRFQYKNSSRFQSPALYAYVLR